MRTSRDIQDEIFKWMNISYENLILVAKIANTEPFTDLKIEGIEQGNLIVASESLNDFLTLDDFLRHLQKNDLDTYATEPSSLAPRFANPKANEFKCMSVVYAFENSSDVHFSLYNRTE
jgi:hypothetical protein